MKIGVYGGAFDPVHIGHIRLAEKISASFGLDKLFFVPSKIPPHKSPHAASPLQRLHMLDITAADLGSKFAVSDFEINSSEVSYTFDTLTYFRSIYKDAELYFMAGSDIFATIKSWKNWRELFGIAIFIVVKRSGMGFDEMMEKIGGGLNAEVACGRIDKNHEKERIILFDTDLPEVSSTFIRENINQVSGLVTAGVLEYIKKNNLYSEA